jgi:hypothetical protein
LHATEPAFHLQRRDTASRRGLADDGMANWEKADEAVIENVVPMAAPVNPDT